jgi:hypothetical protein
MNWQEEIETRLQYIKEGGNHLVIHPADWAQWTFARDSAERAAVTGAVNVTVKDPNGGTEITFEVS